MRAPAIVLVHHSQPILPHGASRTPAVSDLDSSFKNGILRSRMGAAAARSGAPCVPTATPGPWDIPPAIGDAWFIHYPIYTGCVAARLETRSAAQRADHKTDQKTAVATPALATAPQKALARRQGLRVAQAAAEVAVRVAARVASRPQRHGRRARSRLDEIDEEDEEEEDYSNLDEDSGEEQDSETGQGSDDHD